MYPVSYTHLDVYKRQAYFASLECIDIIVTDHYLAEEWQEYIRGVGIELYLV